MEVILKKDVDQLGNANDLLKVKNGYGRNYLIPNGLAILATASVKKMHAENLKQRAFKDEKMKLEAEGMATKLAKVTLKIGAKAGESGKIFGSVNTIQLSEALSEEGFAIDRKDIKIHNEPIKTLGSYEAEVTLNKGTTQIVKFDVIEE